MGLPAQVTSQPRLVRATSRPTSSRSPPITPLTPFRRTASRPEPHRASPTPTAASHCRFPPPRLSHPAPPPSSLATTSHPRQLPKSRKDEWPSAARAHSTPPGGSATAERAKRGHRLLVGSGVLVCLSTRFASVPTVPLLRSRGRRFPETSGRGSATYPELLRNVTRSTSENGSPLRDFGRRRKGRR